jgi:hypothetical protein
MCCIARITATYDVSVCACLCFVGKNQIIKNESTENINCKHRKLIFTTKFHLELHSVIVSYGTICESNLAKAKECLCYIQHGKK